MSCARCSSPVIGQHGLRGGSAARGNVLRSAPAAVRAAGVQAGVRHGEPADGGARPRARPAVPGLPGSARQPDRACRWTITWSCTGTRGAPRQEWARPCRLQRTDLALWTLDARRRTITCRLVEVKCYSAVRGVIRLRAAKGADRRRSWHAASRCSASASTRPPRLADRPDRAVRNAELAGLLRFYLGRAVRHDDARRRRRRGRLAAREPGQRSVPAPVHQDRSDLRPVRGTGRNLVRGRRDRVPPDRARPHRGAAGRRCPPIPCWPPRAQRRALSSLDVSLPKLADAAFRAPDAEHETPAEPRV